MAKSNDIPKKPKIDMSTTGYHGKEEKKTLAKQKKTAMSGEAGTWKFGPCNSLADWNLQKIGVEHEMRSRHKENVIQQLEERMIFADSALIEQQELTDELRSLNREAEAEISDEVTAAIGEYLNAVDKQTQAVKKEVKKKLPNEKTVTKVELTNPSQVVEFQTKLETLLDQQDIFKGHTFLYVKYVVENACKNSNVHYLAKQMKATIAEKEGVLTSNQQEKVKLDDIFKWKGFTATKNDITPHREIQNCRLKREGQQSSTTFANNIGESCNEFEKQYSEIAKKLEKAQLVKHIAIQRRVAMTLSALSSHSTAIMDYADKCQAEGITAMNLHEKQDQVLNILQNIVSKDDAEFKVKRASRPTSPSDSPATKRAKSDEKSRSSSTWRADGEECTICGKAADKAFHRYVIDTTTKESKQCPKSPKNPKYEKARKAFASKYTKALKAKGSN